VAGIYSRHYDGHVRQRWLGTLLDGDEAWTAPFIAQLLGEYVIEICSDIERCISADSPAGSAQRRQLTAFLEANRGFAELTRARAFSYWSCYHQ
jgi:hypothetical protein